MFLSCSKNSNEEKKNGTYTNNAETLFTKIDAKNSNLLFTNNVESTKEFNFITYPYIFSGSGLAVGDIDNDGLQDIYFVSTLGANKLYKNKGDFKFEDITVKSNTVDNKGLSSGVTMLDVNNDGWLDIYVSKAGSVGNDEGRRNLLYVNQKDGSFSEEANQWGLDDPGYSTQAYSLDYDKDGDMDIYLVNYRYDFKNIGRVSAEVQNRIEEITSDQLYRNDGNRYTKVTGEAGLYNKAWGLSASIGDFNSDGWDDIYVSNDFLEPDALYINQQNGTFKNEINLRLKHISSNSMGSDFADLNNDSFKDLITLDMMAEDYVRSKENMAAMSTDGFRKLVEVGYHYPYMANMLHYNMGNGQFKETGLMSGIGKTDWSWAPLIADFDNDGLKDIFISNGVYKDYQNQDFRNKVQDHFERKIRLSLDQILAIMPAEKLSNYAYKNNGDLTFANAVESWGLTDPSFSQGSAMADFDNDGDLDLVMNNIEDYAGLYRNNANQNFIQIKLNGPENNRLGLGTDVYVKNKNVTQLQELYLTRGYESSIPEILHFGLGDETQIEEMIVVWPDGKTSKLSNVEGNQRLEIDYSGATNESFTLNSPKSKKKSLSIENTGINYVHKENDFDDYTIQLLLPQKQSTKGAGIVSGDVNGDGLDDFFVGNAKDAEAGLYLQNGDGTFKKSNETLWRSEAKYEDVNALFFDADKDGDLDLYVVSAGYELGEKSPLLQDRLYKNDGKGNFVKNNQSLPKMQVSGKSIAAGDYDKDGDLDLFIGGNLIPGKYPLTPRSYLLKNENGRFINATTMNTDLAEIGMVSDAVFTDYDGDDDLDLLVVGEWMAPTIYTNTEGSFSKSTTISGFENTEGWWYSITAADFDGDGDQDYVLGNLGTNNKFHPSKEKPLFITAKDFDDNGSFDVALSKINDGKIVPVRGKECSSEQNPFLLDKIKTYTEFAHLEMKDIYGEDILKDAFSRTAYMFETVYAQNDGNGNFSIKKLPNESQTGPSLSLLSKDINKDGHLDIMGIGGIYDAEVETIRYDSNYGYVLLGDGKGEFSYAKDYEPNIDRDTKDLAEITIGGLPFFMVVSNNSPLEIFTFTP